jgi:TPR repeat protein
MQTSIDGKEVAALYSELRDCLGAKNQDQVKRVYRELVRAGRPLSEILGQAANIADIVQKLEPLDASPQQSIPQQPVRLGSMSRNSDRVRPIPEPSDIANTATNHEQDDALLDAATPRSAPTALERITPEVAPRISSRAISFEVGLDPSSGSTDTAPPASRALSQRLAVAVVAIIAIASVGWLLGAGSAVEQVALKSASLTEHDITAAGDKAVTGAAPAKQLVVATVEAAERTREITAATPTLVPAAPSPAAASTAQSDLAALKPDAMPVVAGLGMPESTSPNVSAPPDEPLSVALPSATTPTAIIPPSEPHSSTAEAALLLTRGDSLFGVGDLASARLFYARAADAGSGAAALRLGETYDPDFLERARLRVVQSDPAAAVFWYRRARALGVAEAEILIEAIMAVQQTAAAVATTTGPSTEAARTTLTTVPGAPTGAAPMAADRPSAIGSEAKPTAVDLERIRRYSRYRNRFHYGYHRSGSPSDYMAQQLNVQESGRVSRWRGGLSGWGGGVYDASRESGN